MDVIDRETGETVGRITDEGLETDDEMLRDAFGGVTEDGVVSYPYAVPDEEASITAYEDIAPGEDGYEVAVAGALPWPFDGDWDGVDPDAIVDPEEVVS